jgi:hypothetical protein
MSISYYLYEEDPPQERLSNSKKNDLIWKQGYFSFGTQERIANITAIKFITPDTVVVAHRAVAKLYLVRVEDNLCEIIHSITLKMGSKYYHPDGMDLYKNKLYISTFTDQCPIVEIKDNSQLLFHSVFETKLGVPYHGLYVDNNGIFLGGCAPYNKSKTETCIDYFETLTKSHKKIRFNTGFNRRIKGIDMIDSKNMIVGSDDKRDGFRDIFNSYIHTYKIDYTNQKLNGVDDFKILNAQIDGIKLSACKDTWYATVHYADNKTGYIVIGSVNTKLNIQLLSKFPCDNFPHGLDIYKEFIGFTCYGSSSFSIGREKEMLEVNKGEKI